MERACKNCDFSSEEGSEDLGKFLRCRRRAPNPSMADSHAEWPEVMDSDWCGEFESKDWTF